jgi:hypothetical protein
MLVWAFTVSAFDLDDRSADSLNEGDVLAHRERLLGGDAHCVQGHYPPGVGHEAALQARSLFRARRFRQPRVVAQ